MDSDNGCYFRKGGREVLLDKVNLSRDLDKMWVEVGEQDLWLLGRLFQVRVAEGTKSWNKATQGMLTRPVWMKWSPVGESVGNELGQTTGA